MKNLEEIRPTIAIALVSDEELNKPIDFYRHDNGKLMLFANKEKAEDFLADELGEEWAWGISPVPAFLDLDLLLE